MSSLLVEVPITTLPSGNSLGLDPNTVTANLGDFAIDVLVNGVSINSTVAGLAAHVASTAQHGATGANVGTTNTQTITNKSFPDNSNFFVNSADNTKRFGFNLAGNTAGVTITLTTAQTTNAVLNLPNITSGDTFTTVAATQTLTNKTLTNPVISITPVAGSSATATGWGANLNATFVDNGSTITGTFVGSGTFTWPGPGNSFLGSAGLGGFPTNLIVNPQSFVINCSLAGVYQAMLLTLSRNGGTQQLDWEIDRIVDGSAGSTYGAGTAIIVDIPQSVTWIKN